MKIINKNKKAFTLLEVILAVAILLTASTMIMQGFMSTLQYSHNTSLMRGYGNFNRKRINNTLNAAQNRSYQAADGTFTMTISGVNAQSIDLRYSHDISYYTSGINEFNNGYYEQQPHSISREAITYSLPECPNCHRTDTMRLEENFDNGYRELTWFCSERDACGYRDYSPS